MSYVNPIMEVDIGIREMFESASTMISEKNIDDSEFNTCIDTIMITIEYLKTQRVNRCD